MPFFSDSRLSNLLIAIVAGVLVIVALFEAKGQAAEEPATEPTAHDARADLLARHFFFSAC